jgi:UDPglucose 6-dehydrogenase
VSTALIAEHSTVMPGSTDGGDQAALETHARRAVGDTLGLCYKPEFIAVACRA